MFFALCSYSKLTSAQCTQVSIRKDATGSLGIVLGKEENKVHRACKCSIFVNRRRSGLPDTRYAVFLRRGSARLES
jgi:hypothetical protein